MSLWKIVVRIVIVVITANKLRGESSVFSAIPESPAPTMSPMDSGSPTTSRSTYTTGGSTNIMKAYDCQAPALIKDSTFKHNDQFEAYCAAGGHVGKMNYTQYALLAKEPYQQRRGYSCAIVRDRTVYMCGSADHNSHHPEYSFTNYPMPVQVEDCIRMRETNSYSIFSSTGLVNYSLSFNQEAHFKHPEVGVTEIDSSGEISCVGATWIADSTNAAGSWAKEDGETVYNAVVSWQYRIIIKPEVFISDEVTVESKLDHTMLDCKPTDKGFRGPRKTYVIEGDYDPCKLALVRVVGGIEAEDSKKRVVFMSTDDSLVRVMKGYEESHCERVVYSTNYDTLYLLPWPEDMAMVTKRKLRPLREVTASEISMSVYIHSRGSYLYEHSLDLVSKEFNKIVNYDCRKRYRDAKLYYFIQMQMPSFSTLMLSDNTFATAAGSVLYSYKCKEVLVRAQDSPECFRGVPVRRINLPAPGEIDIYDGKQLYLEPITHRLSTVGVPSACSRIFQAKYRNANGRWIVVNPLVQEAPPPYLDDEMYAQTDQKIFFGDRIDTLNPNTGIYTLGELQALEKVLVHGLSEAALGFNLAKQMAGPVAPGGYITQEFLFPNIPDPQRWASSIWDKIVEFFYSWGNFSAGIVSAIMMIRLGLFIWASISNWTSLKDVYGQCSQMVIWALCPTTFLMRKFQKQRKEGLVPRLTEEELSLLVQSYDRQAAANMQQRIVRGCNALRQERRQAAETPEQEALGAVGRMDQTFQTIFQEGKQSKETEEDGYVVPNPIPPQETATGTVRKTVSRKQRRQTIGGMFRTTDDIQEDHQETVAKPKEGKSGLYPNL